VSRAEHLAPESTPERLTLASPGDLLPGDVIVSVEWDDAAEYVITVDRP
jgi:hypothetical protein